MSLAIAMSRVDYAYGAAKVLDGVCLDVAEGEFVGLVGPNGGGKSTLIKLVLGLLEPRSGGVSVFGRRPRDARGMLGYVPQFRGFESDYPISVLKAVLHGRLGQTRPVLGWRRRDREVAREALEAVGLAEFADRRLNTLSGGQLQRVLIARALACEPRILLLDEPTANVDPHVEQSLFELLRKLNEQLTIVVVSHDVGFISGYVSKVACLNRSLVCHETGAVDAEAIAAMYGEGTRMIHHHSHVDPHECPHD